MEDFYKRLGQQQRSMQALSLTKVCLEMILQIDFRAFG